MSIDGSVKFQKIDGFGVNANTRSWNGKELVPALELLLDSTKASIWRVIVETVEKWEDTNDNNDPFTFNWDYYNKLYETPKFRKAWDMIEYLNRHGITHNLMINFMGRVPLWMGGETIKPEYEDEYIEMLVSFFYYARNVRHLQFGYISPMNEPDIRKEGPTVAPEQFARLLKKLMERMQTLGMGDIAFVAPDVASMNKGIDEYIPELMKDRVIMSKIAHFGLHSYGGYYASVESALKNSPYPQSTYWLTEWNEWCKGCDNGILGEYNYDYASRCINHLLAFLKNGVNAGMIWEGYDSYYEHHAPSTFSYWGILEYNSKTKTYSPRKHFYAFAQVSKFVLPGSRRIAVSETGESLIVVAFYHAALQKVTVVGINTSNSSVTLNGTLANLPAINHFEMYHTNSTDNLHKDEDVTIADNIFKAYIPANCIFTLTGNTGEIKTAGTK